MTQTLRVEILIEIPDGANVQVSGARAESGSAPPAATTGGVFMPPNAYAEHVAAQAPGSEPPHPAEAVAGPFPTTAGSDVCPVHKVAWTYREGGVSKSTGKAYGGFWKCGEKNEDGKYCERRPALAWRPPQGVAAA